MKEWGHDPDENEIHKFLGVKQASRIKMKEVHNRVKEEISRRVNIIARTKLIDKNLVKAINNSHTWTAYPMNVCKFTQSELTELYQVIKRDIKKEQLAGTTGKWGWCDEWLYVKRRETST